MIDKYCGPLKKTGERPITDDERVFVLRARRRLLRKWVVGVALIVFSIPVSGVLGFAVHNLFGWEAVGGTLMLFGLLLGLPAGILIFKDNFFRYRKTAKDPRSVEEYRGTVGEDDISLVAPIAPFLDAVDFGPEAAKQDVRIEIVEGSALVYSVNGNPVAAKNVFLEPVAIAGSDIGFTVAQDKSLFYGVPENAEFEKRHMSEDEAAEILRYVKQSNPYWRAGRIVGLFFASLFVIALVSMGRGGFQDRNGIYGWMVGAFLVLATAVDHYFYFHSAYVNHLLKKDAREKEIWIMREPGEDGREIREEALLVSGLVWTRNGEPALWRLFRES